MRHDLFAHIMSGTLGRRCLACDKCVQEVTDAQERHSPRIIAGVTGCTCGWEASIPGHGEPGAKQLEDHLIEVGALP